MPTGKSRRKRPLPRRDPLHAMRAPQLCPPHHTGLRSAAHHTGGRARGHPAHRHQGTVGTTHDHDGVNHSAYRGTEPGDSGGSIGAGDHRDSKWSRDPADGSGARLRRPRCLRSSGPPAGLPTTVPARPTDVRPSGELRDESSAPGLPSRATRFLRRRPRCTTTTRRTLNPDRLRPAEVTAQRPYRSPRTTPSARRWRW